jgi:hypothetical protein
MGGLDPAKILMILLVAVMVLGPERLPKAARQLGAAWRELTRVRERLEEEVRSALPDLDLPSIPAIPRGGISGYLTGMMTSAASGGSQASGAITGEVVTGAAAGEAADGRTEGGFSSGQWSSAPVLGSTRAVSSTALSASGLPAGWQSIGAPAPGFASGSMLSGVPSVAASGPFAAELELSPDEPSWN